jgi:DNA-binding LacI/PurR family transcriptional regulator
MRQLGYRPNSAARALRNGEYRSIGVIVFELHSFGTTRTLDAIATAATISGYAINLVPVLDVTQSAVTSAFSRLGEQAVDGVIILIEAHTLDEAGVQLPQGLPVVVIDSSAHYDYPIVDTDQRQGPRLATEHLLGLGHCRIAMVGGLPQSYTARRRVQGFQEAMAAADLPVPGTAVTRLGYYPKDGREALRTLVKQPEPPTGLVVANLNAAIGVLSEARSLGLQVPEDLSVISVHDAWTAENTWPPLTTVKMPMYQLGRAAVAGLYARLHGSEVRDHVVREPAPQLVLRESTRPV